MFKCANGEHARVLALEHGLDSGKSVFDGKFYVGTRSQLESIGAVIKAQVRCRSCGALLIHNQCPVDKQDCGR